MTNVSAVLNFYDRLIELYHGLRGSDVNAEPKRRYIPNIQIWPATWLTTTLADFGYSIAHSMQDYATIDYMVDKVNPKFLNYSYISSVGSLTKQDIGELLLVDIIFHEFGKIYVFVSDVN